MRTWAEVFFKNNNKLSVIATSCKNGQIKYLKFDTRRAEFQLNFAVKVPNSILFQEFMINFKYVTKD